MIRVSSKAISRYRERVADVGYDEVIAALTTPVIQKAAAFGAQFVRLGTGQRIVIDNNVVVTVLAASSYRRQINRHGLGRYGRGHLPARFFEGE